MPLRPELADLVACPCDEHGRLDPGRRDGAEVLVCRVCGRAFPFVDGIPDLLLDDALPPEAPGPAGR